MKTYLDLSVYSKQGGLIKRRRRLSRSFTQNLMEGLYVAHAQIPNSAARGETPVYNVGTAIDITPYYRANSTVLKASSPGGGGGTFGYAADNPNIQHMNFVPAEMVGIVIGSGSPTVTPQDKYLVSRIPHGNRAAIATAQSLISQKVNDVASASIQVNPNWTDVVAVCPNRQLYLTSIAFFMYRYNTPGTITCSVDVAGLNFNMNANPNGSYFGYGSGNWNNLGTATADSSLLPTSSSGPYAWLTFTFAAPILLEPGGVYVFRLQSAAGTAYVRYDNSSSFSGRQQPLATQAIWQIVSTNNWQSVLFDLWGTAVDELEYGGCEVHNFQVANPNASFQISRIFRNNGMSTVTIGECGIQALFGWRDSSYGYYHNMPILLIAHDAISPTIALAPGQVLQVSYTPSISV